MESNPEHVWQQRPEPADRDSWESREVYAAFGVAVYFAQVLETGVVNHIAIVRGKALGRRLTDAEFDSLFEELFGKTLGNNLRELEKHVSGVLLNDLRNALKLRNQLVHRFMRERIMDMGTSRRRAGLVSELEAARDQFIEVDARLNAETLRIFESVGVSQERIQAEFERLTAESQTD